jgi:hypothetical protein
MVFYIQKGQVESRNRTLTASIVAESPVMAGLQGAAVRMP